MDSSRFESVYSIKVHGRADQVEDGANASGRSKFGIVPGPIRTRDLEFATMIGTRRKRQLRRVEETRGDGGIGHRITEPAVPADDASDLCLNLLTYANLLMAITPNASLRRPRGYSDR